MTVKSADKKPEKYVGPDGKPKIRMVSVDKDLAQKVRKEEVEQLEEKVNTKGIKKAVDEGKSMDVIMTIFAKKRTTNTDKIRKVEKDYM
jgi:hypothetical protein